MSEKVYRNYANPKECLICHQIKQANEFYKAGGVIKSYCKDCMKKKYKEKTEHIRTLEQEIERLNNDIKELLKENSNKEKVIKIQDNIINKAIEYIKINGNWWTDEIEGCQDLIKILKGEKPIEIAPFKVDTSINVGETTYVGIGSDKE